VLKAILGNKTRIFRPKGEEDGSWRRLHNDELRSLYSSTYIIRMIKSRGMRWAGCVARMREGVYRVLVRRPYRCTCYSVTQVETKT
jgi:hypothetical protein